MDHFPEPGQRRRSDAEPLQPRGTPLTYAELLELAEISPQDISNALDRFNQAVPRRYQNLLD